MLLDPSEYHDIQAVSLTALDQFGNAEKLSQDEALVKPRRPDPRGAIGGSQPQCARVSQQVRSVKRVTYV